MGTYGTFSNRPDDRGARVIEFLTDIDHRYVFCKRRHKERPYLYITNRSLDLCLYPIFYPNHLMSFLNLSLFSIFYFRICNQAFRKKSIIELCLLVFESM